MVHHRLLGGKPHRLALGHPAGLGDAQSLEGGLLHALKFLRGGKAEAAQRYYPHSVAFGAIGAQILYLAIFGRNALLDNFTHPNVGIIDARLL